MTIYEQALASFGEIFQGQIELLAITATDYVNQRATIFASFGAGYPTPDLEQVGKIFDISKLEEYHR